jgi:SSS family solute:Na+ symporter
MAASGNFVNDIFGKRVSDHKHQMLLSQATTLFLGVISFLLASWFTSVLTLVLQSYAFMVSGLLVPTLFAYFSKAPSSRAAFVSMISGGCLTIVLIAAKIQLPYGLDATIFGILASFLLYIMTQFLENKLIHVRQNR